MFSRIHRVVLIADALLFTKLCLLAQHLGIAIILILQKVVLFVQRVILLASVEQQRLEVGNSGFEIADLISLLVDLLWRPVYAK